MYLRLTNTTSAGEAGPVLVAVDDISTIKPVIGKVAKAVVGLRSNPEWPLWVVEDFAEIETAMKHLGVSMVPHGTQG